MAFAPQQYETVYKNRNHNPNGNGNVHNYTMDGNNINNARRVQFSIYGNDNGSNRSMPNLHPLPNESSMTYHPYDEYNNSTQSTPISTHDMEIMEPFEMEFEQIEKNTKTGITSNQSSPETDNSNNSNNSDDSDLHSTNIGPLPLNKVNNDPTRSSILVKHNKLLNQNSHKILKIYDDEDVAPVSQLQQNKEYDHKIYRQYTLSNGSYYDYNHIPDLYPAVSEVHEEEYNQYMHIQPLPHTITTSIPLDEKQSINDDDMKTFNQPIVVKTKRKLSLTKHFSNDIKAYETWMSCCDIQDDTFGYYSALYPLLCEIFAENTKCSRVPKQIELEEVLLKHGATKMKICKFREMNNLSGTINSDIINLVNRHNGGITPPATPPSVNRRHMATVSAQYSGTISFDFDNPLSTPQYLVTIKYKAFLCFWKWFVECCKIIKELAHLWEANNQSTLQCNLFCGREETQTILDQAPQGTFMLRLSSVIKGGIVLSYMEPSFNKNDKRFKHTILIRRQQNQYELRSHAKQRRSNKGNKKRQLTTISTLVRSFVKIKFLYTPHNLYPKKVIF